MFQHRSLVPSRKLVKQLEKSGFSEKSAIRAVLATDNKDIETALMWLTAHEEDDTDPQTRVLYYFFQYLMLSC